MSRVRILNLPQECTERQLRDFIFKSLPANAPPIEVTDIMIKRTNSTMNKRDKVMKYGNQNYITKQDGKIRMAFVGFQTSAAGRFAVQYFHDSYFGSRRIHVELAKGLNDVGTTLGMRKKLELTQRKEEGGLQGAALFSKVSSCTKRARSGVEEDAGHNDTRHSIIDTKRKKTDVTDDNIRTRNEAPQTKTEARKELFIEERLKATEGPSWAAEVLAQHSTNDGNSHRAAVDVEAVEELEKKALEKQRALGEISDMDFLCTLATSTQAVPAERQGDRSEEVEGRCTASHDTKGNESNQEEEGTMDAQAEIAVRSRRVRMGNIPYTASEENVKQFASSLVGPVEEVHIPLTRDTRQSKGAAFVKFLKEDDAVRALTLCRGAIFMGRLLRVSAAEEDPHSKRIMEHDARQVSSSVMGVEGSGGHSTHSGSSEFKIKKEMERRSSNGSGGKANVTWNTMYMNTHTAVDTMARRLGLQADDIVTKQSKGAAVRAAIAEAYLTNEVRQVLSDEGIAFDLLETSQQNLLKARSNTTILVKNLRLTNPQEAAELSRLFVKHGALDTTVFPSSGAFALFRYLHPQDARVAFTRLSFKLFHEAPLFLEWAPVGILVEGEDDVGSQKGVEASEDNTGTAEGAAAQPLVSKTTVYTLFITNIPFHVTEDELHTFLLDSCPRLAKQPEQRIRRLVHQQELGRAFLTVSDAHTFTYCQAKLNGSIFDGRALSCVASTHSPAVAAAGSRSEGAARRNDAQAGKVVEKDEDESEEAVSKVKAINASSHVLSNHGTSNSSAKVPAGCDPHKLIVKNLPFEATEKDVRELFSAFAEIRSVRVPRKSNNYTLHRENNHRGFAFVEFLSVSEAARALEVLRATHLYGRHLVLQYAKLE